MFLTVNLHSLTFIQTNDFENPSLGYIPYKQSKKADILLPAFPTLNTIKFTQF